MDTTHIDSGALHAAEAVKWQVSCLSPSPSTAESRIVTQTNLTFWPFDFEAYQHLQALQLTSRAGVCLPCVSTFGSHVVRRVCVRFFTLGWGSARTIELYILRFMGYHRRAHDYSYVGYFSLRGYK